MIKIKNVNLLFNSMSRNKTGLTLLTIPVLVSFLSCSKIQFSDMANKDNQLAGLGTEDAANGSSGNDDGTGFLPPEICDGTSCTLDPLTSKAAVTTILLALGDKANEQLVINGASSQLIAETVIRYTTPVSSPKILVVQDFDISGEDPEDTAYLVDVLLKRYNVTYLVEPAEGLSDETLAGYDLVWFNNPGHPMSSAVTFETLKRFKGGLVLQGDDLARGNEFSMESLTRIKYLDNGTSATCGDTTYNIDNNGGDQYAVSMNPQYFGSNASLAFNYGNDIDNVEILSNSVQVLATAHVDKAGCTSERPAVLRYFIE